ncbi:MAG: cytochrome P450 [Janthinobacterium lividum]
MLYLEGAEHRERRRSAARFFTPKAVASYETMIDDLTHKQIAPLVRGRRADVSQMSLQLSVAVVARVVGLTSSVLPGKSRRIEATFTANLTADGPAPLALLRRLCTVVAVLLFYLVDVLPAIRTRRRRPGNDLITHLLDVGLRPLEVLTECIIYCAAGMATTREHITIAAWHLLDCPDLLTRFRTGAHAERAAVLQEILRLEPVVGHLYRQVTAPTPVLVDGSPTVLDEGTLIDFDLRAINADVQLVGAEPLALRPGRVLTSRRAAPSVMSFGDGNHRCPGGPLAMLESEIFLDRLLALDLIVDQTPKIAWNDLTGGYELRELVVRQTRQDET